MSLRLVPTTASTSDQPHVVSTQATAHPISGTHDTFRYGLKSAAQDVAAANVSPLQARLEKWASTQQQLQQNLQRNTFGLALPLRQAMDLKTVSSSPHNPLILSTNPSAHPIGGTHNVHLEILQGTDEMLEASDFMGAEAGVHEVLDVNAALARSRGM